MPRPSNTLERRAQIVAGLGRVLAHQGYAGATIADIARAARLAPGLVHYHFADKRSILLALVEKLTATLRARLTALDHGARSSRDRLHAFVDAAVALGPGSDADAVACWVAVCAEAIADREVRVVVARASRQLTDDLRERATAALREAGVAPRAARAGGVTLSVTLWAAIQGSFVVASTTPALIPAGTMAPALHALVDDALDREAA